LAAVGVPQGDPNHHLEDTMRLKSIAGLALTGATLFGGPALLASCSAVGSESTPAAVSAGEAPARETTSVQVSDSQLGDVLVDANGYTLYAFTDDANGMSTCNGACAQSWPPLTVSADWTAGTGLDRAIFHTITRDDGQAQLVAGEWPLYTFAGDRQPGDVNGQGSLGKWFAVQPDATLVENSSVGSPPSTTAPAVSRDGY
jgi:predicted lipoprotein with Yx(FWY)xxD motif